MIKKILVATDGSNHAERALDFAIDLAHQYSAEILIITVVPPLFIPKPSSDLLTKSQALADAIKQLEESFKILLTKAETKAKKTYQKVSATLEYGNPDERIVETAKQGFDIIIMGSRGTRSLYGLGSVSSRVSDNSTCPVLIVK